MSFSCPHFDPGRDWCERVRNACVCGRPGCVLAGNSTFAVPPEQRLAASAAGRSACRPTGGKPPDFFIRHAV